MTATHPTDRQLHDFLLGKLADPDYGEVEAHLADCAECGVRAQAAPAADTLVELLVAAHTRLDAGHATAPTPILDGSATPPAVAPTLAWTEADARPDPAADAPAALAGHPKYRVVRRLGVGGMGTVWLAEHQVMNRPVAVKVIRPDLLARPGATDRFLREVRAAAKLHHPNIATAFDAEQAGDSCLLVMEYVPGETLADRVQAGPLPVAEACRAIRDAARGLAHAHAAGLVHRDVKPHNLIRAADGTTKVLDFGLAGVGAGEVVAAGGDGLTGAGMVVGTPAYIAPEQVADPHAADARADIYGLGCTLYHLLTGRPPFAEASIADTLAAQQTRNPDPIPGLPSDLAAVLAKMTAKRQADRYQTAGEVAEALENAERGMRNAERRKRTRRVLTAFAVAAGVLLATAAAVVFKIQRDNQEITVTTDDPDVEVVMKRKGEVLRVIDKKTAQTWDIDTVSNQIAQADGDSGLTLDLPDGKAVVLRRKGTEVFSITRRFGRSAPDDLTIGQFRKFGRFQGVAYSVAADPGGTHVYAVDAAATKWDTTTGKAEWETALGGEDAGGHSVAVATGGRVLAGCRDGVVRVLDAATGKALHTHTLHTERVLAVAASPDGKRAVSSSGWEEDGKRTFAIKVWAIESGKVQFELTGHTNMAWGVTFSPNGKLIATAADDGAVRLWDAGTGKPLHAFEGHRGMVSAVAFSPDGTRLASAGEDLAIRLWDVPNRKFDRTLDGHDLWVTDLKFTPDGARLVSAGGNDGRTDGVRVWDVATGKPLAHFREPTSRVNGLAVLPGGRIVVSAETDGVLRAFRLADPAALSEKVGLLHNLRWPGENANIYYSTFSPDGRYFLTGGDIWSAYTSAWEAVSGKLVTTIPAAAGAVFLPDRRHLLATSHDQRLIVWDMLADQEVRKFEAHAGSGGFLSVSADGSRAVSTDHPPTTLVVWDVATGKPLAEWPPGHDGPFIAKLSPDGQRIVTLGYKDRLARLWNVGTKKVIKTWTSEDQNPIGLITFLPDGRSFVTAADGPGRIALFDESADGPTWLGDLRYFGAAGISPDGRFALLSDGTTTVVRYDLKTGQELGRVTLPTDVRGHLGVSPDGTLGAVTGPRTGTGKTTGRVYVFRMPAAPAVEK